MVKFRLVTFRSSLRHLELELLARGKLRVGQIAVPGDLLEVGLKLLLTSG